MSRAYGVANPILDVRSCREPIRLERGRTCAEIERLSLARTGMRAAGLSQGNFAAKGYFTNSPEHGSGSPTNWKEAGTSLMRSLKSERSKPSRRWIRPKFSLNLHTTRCGAGGAGSNESWGVNAGGRRSWQRSGRPSQKTRPRIVQRWQGAKRIVRGRSGIPRQRARTLCA